METIISSWNSLLCDIWSHHTRIVPPPTIFIYLGPSEENVVHTVKNFLPCCFFIFLIQLLIETILTNLKIDVFINSVWFKGALLAWETDHTCHCQRKSEIKSTKKNINRITFPCNMNIQISETGIIEYTLCRLAVKQKKVWCQYDTTEATALFPVK